MNLQDITISLYLLIILGVVVFQFCLLFGAPWGEYTQGGQNIGTLPASGRVAAALSIPILIFMAASMTTLIGLGPHLQSWTLYVTVCLQGLTAIANWITQSRKERFLWGTITTIAFLLVSYVAFSS